MSPLPGVQPLSFSGGVPGSPVVARRRTIVGVGSGFEHAGRNWSQFFEAAFQGCLAQVSFSDQEGLVPGIAERLCPERRLFELLLGPKGRESRIQHGSTG